MAANVPIPQGSLSISHLKKIGIVYIAAVMTICAELAHAKAPPFLYLIGTCVATLILQACTMRKPGSTKS